MSEKKVGLELLREPFPENQISLLPKPYKRDSEKGKCNECGGYHGLPAIHLKYVGHAALTDRLLDVDPSWSWEPLAFDDHGLPRFDASGGLWIKLTILGITRLGYGNAEVKNNKEVGAREKEVIGDCLRNAAMRFGAALDLWHKGDLHGDEEVENKPIEQVGKNGQPKPFKAPHKPVDGALESLSERKQSEICDKAVQIDSLMRIGEISSAYGIYTSISDADERVALQSQLSSTIRSALKKFHEELKKEKAEA